MPKRCFNYENVFEHCSVNRRERVRSICNFVENCFRKEECSEGKWRLLLQDWTLLFLFFFSFCTRQDVGLFFSLFIFFLFLIFCSLCFPSEVVD